MTPTARTLQYLRKRGITADVVERWIAGAGVRKDFLGIIDVIALWPAFAGGHHIIGIQATSGTNHSSRCRKVESSPSLFFWRSAGAFMEVWSWSKRGPRGKRKLWTLRRSRWDGSKWTEVA